MKNFEKVFRVFRKHYKLVPLEVFGKDSYKTLFSTILSSRTKDETTLAASKRLFKKAPNISSLAKLPEKTIQKLIYPVGFYKTKAKHIKKAAEKVVRNFDGKVPNTKRDLMSLPGVGRKTANLVLNRAFGKKAIAVDTHVHKIANLLGWVHTNSPRRTERDLMKILPKKYWTDINRLFVSIGRQHTTKKRLLAFLKDQKLLDKHTSNNT
jgi:endonuclease-3